MLLEETYKYSYTSENEAKLAIEQYREQARVKGYIVKKAGYEYKTKKSKGEIIAEVWVTTVILTYNDLWSDLV